MSIKFSSEAIFSWRALGEYPTMDGMRGGGEPFSRKLSVNKESWKTVTDGHLHKLFNKDKKFS